MTCITAVDERTGRKFYLDEPDDLRPGQELVFILNLHGGGSVGAWQRDYFPASDHVNAYRMVVATPSAATKEPTRHWRAEADDAHLEAIVQQVFERYGRQAIRAFWLAGHSQGGMTSNRLLQQPAWKDLVDGWLSLSGGRMGPVEIPESFYAPHRTPGQPPRAPLGPRPATVVHEDISFIYAIGEHEIVALPEVSPLGEAMGAGPRVRLDDIVDDEAGKIYDTTREGRSTAAWGLYPRPGRAEVYLHPGARDGRLIADVVRIDKGHTEGLEPKVTEAIVRMIVEAPGGKARRAAVAA
jgi:hypothetical protein